MATAATINIHHKSGFDQLKTFRSSLLVRGEWKIQVKIDEEVGTLVNPRKIQLVEKRGSYSLEQGGRQYQEKIRSSALVRKIIRSLR